MPRWREVKARVRAVQTYYKRQCLLVALPVAARLPHHVPMYPETTDINDICRGISPSTPPPGPLTLQEACILPDPGGLFPKSHKGFGRRPKFF